MKRSQKIITVLVLSLALLPLLLSLVWRDVIGPCDYASQAGLLLLSLIGPLTVPIQWSGRRLFFLLYGVWIIWGVWRMGYFDIVTTNDIPGMGYLVAPLLFCSIAVVLFHLRKGFSKTAF